MLKVSLNHKLIYFWCLILIAISLPFSDDLILFSFYVISANWLFEGNLKTKFQIIYKRKSVLIFICIFLIYAISLSYSENYKFGIHILKSKLPLLIFPIIVGTSEALNKNQIRNIILWFFLSVFITTIVSSLILFGIINYPINDFRDISIFISHIRFGLMINFAIFSSLYLIINNTSFNKRWHTRIILLITLWLIIFLFLLKSLTGIVLFVSVAFIFILVYSKIIKKPIIGKLLKYSFFIFVLLFSIYIYTINKRLFNVNEIKNTELNDLTRNGNPYEHNLKFNLLENGNYVWINVCNKELEEEWVKRSNLPYNGIDYKGQELKSTLIRYLTSKNLTKDAEGFASLSNADVKNIENGIANYIFENKYSLYPRLYQNLWEFDCFKKGFDYSNSSLISRMVFAKTAFKVFEKNFWIGVGIGDVKNEMQKQYKKDNSSLPKWKRMMPHNQYVSILIAFGIIGFIVIFFSLIFPVFYEKKQSNFLITLFLLIVFFSFINEDTIESYTGVCFIVYFYSIFVFGMENKTNLNNQ